MACPEPTKPMGVVPYVAGTFVTAIGEVFGDYNDAEICPNYRVALMKPVGALDVLDLRGQGAAMRVGAHPSLATGPRQPRSRAGPRLVWSSDVAAGGRESDQHRDESRVGNRCQRCP
jgi:hypothetical protein